MVRKSLIIIPLLGILMAVAGSQNGQYWNGLPIFAICVGLAFLINWVAFIPAYRFQTEKFYDLTGSTTYIVVTILALLLSTHSDIRSYILAFMVIVWAARLGTFLYRRIHKAGKDDRFDKIKPNFARFLNAWTLQALWVTLTAAPAFVAITSNQKTQFRKDPANRERFISTGLWARSRHPNYFGEILLWIGVSIVAIPALQGWQWLALISPIFVSLLLTRVSGVPMLEAKADKKWGGQDDYETYKANTPILIPKF